MKVSVVLTTARYGGIDVLHHCMAHQTMPREEFEIIVVDELRDERPDVMKPHRFNTKHLRPPESETYNNTAGFNAGLLYAEGELVCFMVDFMWVYPRYLEDHWNFYNKNPGWSMTGYIDRYALPPLDEKNGYCIFEDIFDEHFAEGWFKREPVYRERKGGKRIVHPDGRLEMPGELIYLIPDSVPLAVCKELNGLDEMYDGGYGSNDIDFGVRANMLGWHFGLNENCVVQKLGVPGVSETIPGVSKPKIRTAEQNYAMFRERVRAIADGRESLAVPEGRGAFR